jgi:hydroxymethylpyrimidine kinase/phosphomethylpyrimidine kinase/thiamine-phosphate diphosphorylase
MWPLRPRQSAASPSCCCDLDAVSAPTPPIIWSIAGHDTAGGAGLSADQRAADAMGVHLCPVVAAITAQHSTGVDAVYPVPLDQLEAQLSALAQDLPPRVIKTGLLGSIAAIEAVARWVDRLRAAAPAGQAPHQHLALVVDPVLRASSGGAAFSNEAIVAAYREHLLPRATVITPNRDEAWRLRVIGTASDSSDHAQAVRQDTPALAQALQAQGARAVMITGGDAHHEGVDRTHSLDWLLTPHASGWLTAPRVDTPHHHGTGCTLASGIAAALALGHVEADACMLGKMLTHHALMHSHAAGQGRGPVQARRGFAAGPAQGGAPLPRLGLGDALPWTLAQGSQAEPDWGFQPFAPPSNGLYGIAANATMLTASLSAGVNCMQLRHKASSGLSEHLPDCVEAAARFGAQLFINDHWQAALALPPQAAAQPGYRLGVHLGQEDLLKLSPAEMATLTSARERLMLGLSSHSLWELARAAGCGASYIACGPVLPTTTKDMPWHPQGQDNLRWWVAHSPVPVVAIGGLLTPEQVSTFAACGAAALCVVRGLGETPEAVPLQVALMQAAVRTGQDRPPAPEPPWPHPVL